MAELIPGFIAGTFPANVHRMIHTAVFLRSGAAGVSGQVQARSGVLGFRALKVAPSTALTLSVASGVAVLQGSGVNQGAYVLVNSSDDTITLNTANATLPRKDAVIARVYDATDGVGGNGNQWVIDKVTGNPAASPSLPSLPTDSMLLAEVNVLAAATTVTSGNIVDRRTFTIAAGGVLPVSGGALPTDPAPGQIVYATDTNTLQVWNGSLSSWVSLHEAGGWTSLPLPTGYTSVSPYPVPAYRLESGKRVIFRGACNVSSSNGVGTKFVMPTGFRPTAGTMALAAPYSNGTVISGHLRYDVGISGNINTLAATPAATVLVSFEGLSYALD